MKARKIFLRLTTPEGRPVIVDLLRVNLIENGENSMYLRLWIDDIPNPVTIGQTEEEVFRAIAAAELDAGQTRFIKP